MFTIAAILVLLKVCSCNVIFPTVNGTFEGDLRNYRPINPGPPPEAFDWRDQKMISPVKDQRNCAACWAFSTIASIESHHKIYNQEELVLSEQFLIDCDGNEGCGNKGIIVAFANIVTKLGGVLRNDDYYPYAEKKLQCRWSPKPSMNVSLQPSSQSDVLRPPSRLVPVVGFRRVPPNEDEMVKYLYQYGPLAAAINDESMVTYQGGIDEPTKKRCNPDSLNHAVLIVGYDFYEDPYTGKRTPYWVIKNSWGQSWGDNGFYYLVRGRNACGISKDVSFPFVN